MVTTPNPPTSTSFRFAELPGALVVSHPSTQRAQWQPLRPWETPTVQQLRDPGGDSSWYTWILLQESSIDGQIDQRRKSRWNLFFGFLLLTAVFFFRGRQQTSNCRGDKNHLADNENWEDHQPKCGFSATKMDPNPVLQCIPSLPRVHR